MRGDGLSVALIAAAAIAIGVAQLPGRVAHRELKEGSDAYLLPPPEQLVRMSLGYRAATADVLWADLQVTQGLRLFEKRRYALSIQYLDAINELDPKWRDPYRMADTLVTMQAKAASLQEIREVRRILERGVRERPNDAELWFVLGAFMTFIAPNSYMESEPEEAAEWRRIGAVHLARAAELAPKDANITWQTLGGARILAENGQIDRSIEMLTTVLATSEDPELRENVERRLEYFLQKKQEGAAQLEFRKHKALRQRFVELSVDAYAIAPSAPRKPGANLETSLLLGPPRDPARCAGGSSTLELNAAACAKSWRAWSEAQGRAVEDAMPLDPGVAQP